MNKEFELTDEEVLRLTEKAIGQMPGHKDIIHLVIGIEPVKAPTLALRALARTFYTAGRGIGRREMKGEAVAVARNGKVRFVTRGIRNHLELDDVRERIASAIEAITEDIK